MSERTTIGGVTYESIGSNSSNLLLKCNGTARILWGNRLIDLIKNGKIASGNDVLIIFSVENESDIDQDGIYIVTADNLNKLILNKDNVQYNLTELDLYISATKEQTLTVDLKNQALFNIGMFYNNIEEVKKANIKNGIVYVIDNKTFYTIKEGILEEFEAKIKTVEVDKKEDTDEIINGSVKIILSILDKELLVVFSDKILSNLSIHISESKQLGSVNASLNNGYRLYIKDGVSYLDVDEINVRNGLPISNYEEVTYSELRALMSSGSLKSQQLYVITDFQNHWKLFIPNSYNNRPLLVKARTLTSLYEEGELLNDNRIKIHYNPYFEEIVKQNQEHEESESLSETETETETLPTEGDANEGLGVRQVTTRGMITWMKDANNNEANFDFLDYTDCYGNPLTTLHDSDIYKSIFPKLSYNNKLTVYNLKGTVLKDGILDDTNVSVIDFKFPDTAEEENNPDPEKPPVTLPTMEMYDNTIECRNLILTETCNKFIGNILTEISNILFNSDIVNCSVSKWYSTEQGSKIENFSGLIDNNLFSDIIINSPLTSFVASECINTSINKSITESVFKNISNCVFNSLFNLTQFKNITNSTFGEGNLLYINCYSDVLNCITSNDIDPLLYYETQLKEVYFRDGKFQVINNFESAFCRGMIVMHSGIEPIPIGWAICDGGTYTHNGVLSTTPNLINRFIKAVGSSDLVGYVNNSDLNTNNDFTLKESHLPKHTHPHLLHAHTLSKLSGEINSSGDLTMLFNGDSKVTSISTTSNSYMIPTEETPTESTAKAILTVSYDSANTTGQITGGNHTHTITISEGTISNSTSTEATKTWENVSFKIEPNYYALIFIMKL